jgi:pyruvate formate lyase activating enzyme
MQFGGFNKYTLIDYPGKIACMVYTIGCNFRCPYCHNPGLIDETVDERFEEENILAYLEKRRNLIEGVVITGGEPTMHSELPEFIRVVKDMGFAVKLDTNGTNTEMLASLLNDSRLDYVAMDMKAPLAKYSQTVARPVDTVAIKRSIDILISSGIEYEFRTTVVKALLSTEDIEEICKEIRGAKKYFLQKFVSSKILNSQFKRKVSYTDDEFQKLKTIASEYVDFCGVR